MLEARKHRTHNRRHWQNLRLPCARCRGAIDYDGKQYLSTGEPNPRYLIVGHIVGRKEALARGWTDDQINDLSNSRPECQQCSVTGGGEERARLQKAGRTGRRRPLILAPEASRW